MQYVRNMIITGLDCQVLQTANNDYIGIIKLIR